jgi:hypothetical protein
MALKKLVKELFEILDTEEQTDEGRYFRPTTFSSCRTDHVIKLNKILEEMRVHIKGVNKDDQ